MKMFNIKMFALAALLSITGYSFGYQFGVSNLTDKPLLVRVLERQIGTVDQYKVLQPEEKHAFNFEGAMCLKSIEAAPYNPDKRWEGNNDPKYNKFKGKNLLEIQNMGVWPLTDHDALVPYGELARTYALRNLEMKMEDNEVFKNTAKAAKLLTKGLDNLACKITDIAMKSQTGGLVGTDTAKTISDLVSGPEQDAGGAKIEAGRRVAEARTSTDPKVQEIAEVAVATAKTKIKIVELDKLETKFGGLLIDDTTFEHFKIPVPAAIAALVAVKDQFADEATYNKIKGLLDKGSNTEAAKALAGYIEELKRGNTTKTSIDDEVIVEDEMINNGCSRCSVNTYMDTTGGAGAAKKKEACSFGLGEIAKASAALTEQSLCQNRDFIILSTGVKEETEIGGRKYKLPYDKMIAITSKGG